MLGVLSVAWVEAEDEARGDEDRVLARGRMVAKPPP